MYVLSICLFWRRSLEFRGVWASEKWCLSAFSATAWGRKEPAGEEQQTHLALPGSGSTSGSSRPPQKVLSALLLSTHQVCWQTAFKKLCFLHVFPSVTPSRFEIMLYLYLFLSLKSHSFNTTAILSGGVKWTFTSGALWAGRPLPRSSWQWASVPWNSLHTHSPCCQYHFPIPDFLQVSQRD